MSSTSSTLHEDGLAVAGASSSSAAAAQASKILPGSTYVDPDKLKKEFLAQYGGPENLTKQELRDLEEAFEAQQKL